MKKLFFITLLYFGFITFTFAQKPNYKIFMDSNFFTIEQADNLLSDEIGFFSPLDSKIEFELKSTPSVLGKCLYSDFSSFKNKHLTDFLNKISEDGSVLCEIDPFLRDESTVTFYYYETNIWGTIPVRCSSGDGIFNLAIFSNNNAILSIQIKIENGKLTKLMN